MTCVHASCFSVGSYSNIVGAELGKSRNPRRSVTSDKNMSNQSTKSKRNDVYVKALAIFQISTIACDFQAIAIWVSQDPNPRFPAENNNPAIDRHMRSSFAKTNTYFLVGLRNSRAIYVQLLQIPALQIMSCARVIFAFGANAKNNDRGACRSPAGSYRNPFCRRQPPPPSKEMHTPYQYSWLLQRPEYRLQSRVKTFLPGFGNGWLKYCVLVQFWVLQWNMFREILETLECFYFGHVWPPASAFSS